VRFYRAWFLLGAGSNYLSLEQPVLINWPSCREQATCKWSARPNSTATGGLSRPQRVSVTGAGEEVSDGEGVVATFFLIRYQTVVAIRTDITFARQFSRVSLARRTESNFARQFFELNLFINCCAAKFPRFVDETSPEKLRSIRGAGKWKCRPCLSETNYRQGVRFLADPEARARDTLGA
jgi:hypothetical protein